MDHPNDKIVMMGSVVDSSAHVWRIYFTIKFNRKTNNHKVEVSARCLDFRKVLHAPRDLQQILELWPLEFWPEFAKSLAEVKGSIDNNQEGLF